MNYTIKDKQKLLNFFLEITNNDKSEIKYIKNLIEVYPNVLDYMILNETPDLSKVLYVKQKRYNSLKLKVLDNFSLLELNSLLNDAFPISLLKILKNNTLEKFENDFASNEIINNYIVKQIKNYPYDTLCNLPGIGFIRADKILLEAYNISPDLWNFNLFASKYRLSCFIAWYLLTNLSGSTYIDISELNSAIYKYNLTPCKEYLSEALEDVRFKTFKLYNSTKIMLTSDYLQERNISNYIKDANMHSVNWNIDINKYKSIDSFELTNDQLETLRLINKYQIVLLNGYAGTGKSSSIKALINMLEDNNKTYRIISPTAKAAKQISKYTDRPASTIHYLLCGAMPDFDYELDKDNEYVNISNLNFYNETDGTFCVDELPYDMLIIDETSMLSISLFNILLKYVNNKKTKILLIGDSYQLPSIQRGNLYQDLLDINEIPKITLNEIFRYKEDGLVSVATDIRYGKQYLNNSHQLIGNSYEFYNCSDIGEMLNQSLNKYLSLINFGIDIEDIAILTAKNIGKSGTYLINNCIQKVINPINDFDDYIEIEVDKNKIKFKENDYVMNIKNNYHAISLKTEEKCLLANGQIGKIKSINIFAQTAIVEIEDDLFEFQYADIRNLRLAYCYTIHKSQGSQFKYIIYLTSKEDGFMTSSNLEYVAVTRAQIKCFHYGDMYTINRKVNERENLKRNTTLVNQFYSII